MNLRDFSLILVVFLVPATCSEDDGVEIIDGQNVTTLEFPYQVAIEVRREQVCGGSVIDHHYVLTAAHCVASLKTKRDICKLLRVRAASDETVTGGKLYTVTDVIIHEKYNEKAQFDQYDIALIRVRVSFRYNDRIRPVGLADATPKGGDMAWISGYGRQALQGEASNTTRHLMAVQLPIVELERCKKIMGPVADDMICAGFESGHKDACIGDGGGPLVINGTQVGIVAWGVGCGRTGYRSVHTNVAMYKDWINEKMKTKVPTTPKPHV